MLLFGFIISRFSRSKGRYIAYKFTRFVSIILMKLTGAILIPSGLENIHSNENFLFVSNHVGLLDSPLLMMYVNEPLSFISKQEMRKVPILRQWMELQHCLFLNRSNSRAAIKTILQGIHNIKLGDNMIIFPQGTRSLNNEFLPFKQGSFKLALKSGVRIIPVSIKGTNEVLEDNAFNVKSAKVYIHFGKPIDLGSYTKEDQKQCAAIISRQIKETYDHF